MSLVAGKHLDEETAEKYSLGRLSARKAAGIEEHLLLCESCRQILTSSDAYVAAMQKASAKVRQAEQKKRKKNRLTAGR